MRWLRRPLAVHALLASKCQILKRCHAAKHLLHVATCKKLINKISEGKVYINILSFEIFNLLAFTDGVNASNAIADSLSV